MTSEPRRVLLTCHDAGGTVPPLLAIAEALVDDGHTVLVLGQPSVRRRAEAVGCTFAAFSKLPDYDKNTALEDQLALTLPALTGSAVGDDVSALAEQHDVDVVVVDANLAGALAAAEKFERPSAVLLHSMYKTFVDTWFGELWPFVAPAINRTRAGYGLPECADWPAVFAPHDRVIAVVPTVFDAPVDVRPETMRNFGFLVPRGGPSDARPDFPPGDDATVLVGLSTTYQQQGPLLRTIVEALGDLAARALVATAGHADIDALPRPANVAIVDYIPYASVLHRTDVMVTHAGLGTVASALSAGVPLVCTPLARDQPLNASRVAELGAGIVVDAASPAAAIAAGIEAVLTTGRFRQAARALAASARAEGGPAAAASDLVALVD